MTQKAIEITTQKKLLAKYPVIVSTNTQEVNDLNHIIKDFEKKHCRFALVRFRITQDQYYAIVRKLDPDENFVPAINFLAPKKKDKEVEIIKIWN